MLEVETHAILQTSKAAGWVMEPEAKRILALAGIDVPKFKCAVGFDEALEFAGEIGYPVVAKIVSPKWIHKSDGGGVVLGIEDGPTLKAVVNRFRSFEGFSGVLIEEKLKGMELIIGAKIDYQFGPVILLGIGGIDVEIYRDTALRMAPIGEADVESMIKSLKAHPLLMGHRGSNPVNPGELTRLMVTFSDLVMSLEGEIESIDLNPVICSSDRCVVADARIILKKEG